MTRKRKKRERIIVLTIYVVLVGGFLIMCINSWRKSARLEKNHVLTTGIVMSCAQNAKGSGISIGYKYEVNGRHYSGHNAFPEILTFKKELFVNKHFPVAYEVNNVENCQMLITSLDFSAYNMQMPDSLKWVLKYEKK